MAFDLSKLIERLPKDPELEEAQARDNNRGNWQRVSDDLYSAFSRKPFEATKLPSEAEQLTARRDSGLKRLQGAEAAQGFAEENDPDSQSTNIARQYAKQIGIQVPEGATYASMKRGFPMLEQLVERQKAAEKLKASQLETEKKRLEKETDDARNRAWRVEDRDINNVESMRRAEVMARQRAGAAADLKDEDKVEKLSKGVPEEVRTIATKLEQLQASVGDFEEGNKSPIPGQGPVEGRLKNIPLVGPWLESEEGKKADQSVFGIVSTLMKLQSGSAVSEKEVARKMTELGFGQDVGPESFRRGVRNLRAELANVVRQKYSGYTPKVVGTYEERGGVAPSQIERIGTKAAPPASPTKKTVSMMNPKTKEVFEFEPDDPELEHARKLKWVQQ